MFFLLDSCLIFYGWISLKVCFELFFVGNPAPKCSPQIFIISFSLHTVMLQAQASMYFITISFRPAQSRA